MSIWEDRNLKYLLCLFERHKIRGIDELSSIIFLSNYYGLLNSGKTFFSYRFVKSRNFIEALGLKEDLKEIILSNLALFLSEGFFKLTRIGKKILNHYTDIGPQFIEIIDCINEEDSRKKVSEFIFIQNMKDRDEIIL